MGGTYLGWGYLPLMGRGTYFGWGGVPTLNGERGTYLGWRGQGVPTLYRLCHGRDVNFVQKYQNFHICVI